MLLQFGQLYGIITIIVSVKIAKEKVNETEFVNGTLNMSHRFTMKQSGERWIWDDLQYSLDGKKSWSNDSI